MSPEVPINAEVPVNIDSLLWSVQVTAKTAMSRRGCEMAARLHPGADIEQRDVFVSFPESGGAESQPCSVLYVSFFFFFLLQIPASGYLQARAPGWG